MSRQIVGNHPRGLRAVALALLVGASVPASAFAGGTSAVAVPKTSKAAVAATCQRVADILSDGPDPDVDPVGYALAQVRPLRQVKTTDQALHVDIDNLASAFEVVYKTNDKKGTEAAVRKAGKKLDTICPGAF